MCAQAWYPIWPRVESYAAEHLFIERLLADAEVSIGKDRGGEGDVYGWQHQPSFEVQ
jgi:hypothetical protein